MSHFSMEKGLKAEFKKPAAWSDKVGGVRERLARERRQQGSKITQWLEQWKEMFKMWRG